MSARLRSGTAALVACLLLAAGTPLWLPPAAAAGESSAGLTAASPGAAAPSAADSTGAEADTTDIAPLPDAIVYYFHPAIRCEYCLTLEAITEATLRDSFPGELASGAIRLEVLDFEAPENAALADRYELYSSSIVVQEVSGEDPQWSILEGFLELTDYPGLVSSRIAAAVRDHLERARGPE
jgi:hypothetical protein